MNKKYYPEDFCSFVWRMRVSRTCNSWNLLKFSALLRELKWSTGNTQIKVKFQPISERISTMTVKEVVLLHIYLRSKQQFNGKKALKNNNFLWKTLKWYRKHQWKTCIVIGGDFNTKTRMRNRDFLLNSIIWNYAKSDRNEYGEKSLLNSNNVDMVGIKML